MKENKLPTVGDSTTGCDLDEFVIKLRPSKNHWTTWRRARRAEYPNTHSVGTEDLDWRAWWEEYVFRYPSKISPSFARKPRSYGRYKSKLCHNLMDKNDPCFKLFGTCDSVAQQLPKEGVGGSVKHGPLSGGVGQAPCARDKINIP